MRVLHVVKTCDGAGWAAAQVAELTKLGVEVHVALPRDKGLFVDDWMKAGAILHIVPLDFPSKMPWRARGICDAARKLVAKVGPDIIHSHFVGTTLVMRFALGRKHRIPRLFQIPGPLHLEHSLFRTLELSSAGQSDYWVCSSKYIWQCLERAGIPQDRLFLSYYGNVFTAFHEQRTNVLRDMLGIKNNQLVVGNISWIYPPKCYLGQSVGLKCHEDLIEALAQVTKQRRDVVGVLAGGTFGRNRRYEDLLRARANKIAGDRIKMPGALPSSVVANCWPDFDCAVHVPLSENCGGVIEPLMGGVPTIASNIGGLPEVIINGITGRLVPVRKPLVLATAILEVLEDLERYRSMASAGRVLVTRLFDVRRTAQEVYGIYEHLLGSQRSLVSIPRPLSCI